jgi:hypothetical protein
MYWQKLRDQDRILAESSCYKENKIAILMQHFAHASKCFIVEKATNNEQLALNASLKPGCPIGRPSQVSITRSFSKEERFRINNVHKTTSGFRNGRHRN